MNVLKQVFFFVVFIFVVIGDFMISLFASIKNAITKITNPARNRKKKKLIKETFVLSKPKKNKQIKRVNVFSQFFNSVLFIAKKTILYLILLIKLLFKKIFQILSIPVEFIKRKRDKYKLWRTRHAISKIVKKKKVERKKTIKKTILKPSIFYKLKYVFLGFIVSFIFLFLPLLSLLFLSELPSPANLSVNYIPKTTKIYDKNGNLLYEIFANQNRTIVRLQDIPKMLRNATIAIEDKDFYSHPGFDLKGIIRAFVTNIKKEGFQGGSTITQQLVKSAFLSPDPTIIRKVKEIALAFWTERIYSKDQILELYFNFVPYGGTAWGIQSASEIYFGKKASDLTLSESAFLAGLPRAPSVYSPYFGNGKLWKKRQKEVLDAMVRLSYINQEDADKAYQEELQFKSSDVPIKAPHFVMYVRSLLVNKYGLSEVERGGLQVKTTLDLETQEKVEQIVAEEVDNDSYLNISNGAALVTVPSKGDILAMVGSKNYFDRENDGNVNLTTSLRQPGSAIKLITYALALSSGFTEATILDDTPITIYNAGEPPYSPVNYDGAFHGKIPLRTAFGNSFNIPPVRITQKLGASNVKKFGEDMGITSWVNAKNYGISITLGGLETKMTDLATAYGVIANGGNRIDLNPIMEVKDSYGKVLYEKNTIARKVIDPGVAFIISDILADPNARLIEFGANTPLRIPDKRVSVKTGTTDNKRDNWTIGFTPNILVATWVGNNDNSPMNPALASGITGAAPMWNKIISNFLDDIPASLSAVPSDVIKKYCLGQDRFFIRGTETKVNCAFPSISPSPTPASF